LEAIATAEREAFENQRREEEAAIEQARIERERLEAIEREKANVDRVRKAASQQANEALSLAKQVVSPDSPSEILPSDIRFVAGRGKNDLLAHYISQQPDMVDASDGSGWRPIHEAARGGNLAGIQLLIDSGSDLSARTGRGGNGGTALWWAIQRYGEDSDVVRLLRSYGAPDDGPEL
jgi:ankyrin repeat protein